MKDFAFVFNPERYFELWPVEPEVDEDNIDWLVPQTEGDIDQMMSALRDAGVYVDPGLTE